MSKIILTKKTNAIFLAIVLVAGVFAISSPLTVYGQQYEQDYQQDYESSYYPSDPRMDDKSHSKQSQRANCDNKNINVNDINQIQRQNQAVGNTIGTAAALNGESLAGEEALKALTGNGDPLFNIDRNIVNICINSNDNTLTGTFTPTQTQTPPEPTTATLTVKKQVFGCGDFDEFEMDCDEFQNNSPAWLDCNTNPTISGTIFCQSLPESIFDIEVLDDQNTQIQEFVGSEQGTIIQNLEPGTYTVNEIKVDGNLNELGIVQEVEDACVNLGGFSDGGDLFNTASNVFYRFICFEYVDEQGNDCSTIAIAAGEERTCTVKNYIRLATQQTM